MIVRHLVEVLSANRKAHAKDIRRKLFGEVRIAMAEMGEDFAGYAVVTWDREGNLRSAYDTSGGPIRAPLVPTLVADALNRHVAVMIARQHDEANEV